MALKNAIGAEAKRLGFKLVGVTKPDPPPHLDIYENWINQARHGEMGYLSTDRARTRRANPNLIMPECNSILVLGMEHTLPESFQEMLDLEISGGQFPTGKIASYAWGPDYHEVIPERLEQLIAFIHDQVGEPVPYRTYTDTGPILERELAQRAGLGWIGKNTCLINPRRGSFFLLAELFLGIELEADPPFAPDRCGSCTRCIEACPTGCILSDRTIDASQCISYLTIELKGPIPEDLRPKIGNWIFGCDICQLVCPWNLRFAAANQDRELAGELNQARRQLLDELSLSNQGFNHKFKGTPLKRAKRRGYLRNVAVALGNSRTAAGIQPLVHSLLNEAEPLIRGHVAWALGQYAETVTKKALGKAAGVERDPYVLKEIEAALSG